MMKTGGNQRKSGCHVKNIRRKKEEKYRQTGGGFYQKEQPPAERKPDLETMLIKFMEASEKRHEATDSAINE